MHPFEEHEPNVPLALGRLRVALDNAHVEASRALGLTPQQAELLCAAMHPAAVGSLAAFLRCDRSNVTRLVERASLRGLVRRRNDKADRRVTMVELTPAGRRTAERFMAQLEARTRSLLTTWSRERQREAAGILGELAGALESSTASPTQPVGRRLGSRA